MVCTFFGHKDASFSIYAKLLEVVEDLIKNRSVNKFLVGNQGEFDSMVLKAVCELKKQYPKICYNVVLAYMPDDKQKYGFYSPFETIFPDGIETVPKRFAISWRNKRMAKESQIVVCYINHSWGGAAQFVEYAKNKARKL